MLKHIGRGLLIIRKISDSLIRKYQKSLFCKVGNNFIFDGGIFSFKNINCGDNVYIGPNAIFLSELAKIDIGNNVMFGPNVIIVTGNHRIDVIGEYMNNVNEKLPENDEDVIIQDDVWIGAGAIILKGVCIGKGSIVGAGSVVTNDIPSYTIYVGTKSRKLYKRFTVEEILRHEKKLLKK